MWQTLLLALIPLIKEVPELLDLLNQIRAGGQDAPTQEQVDALDAAVTARGIADDRWDNFKASLTRRRPKKPK